MRPMPYAAGSVVAGRYRIESPVAAGAAGPVLAARDLDVDLDVALKVLAPGLIQGAAEQERFKAVALESAAERHPHWVRIYDVGSDGQHLFYTMPLLHGVTLRQIIDARLEQGRSFTAVEVVPLFRQIVDGLAALPSPLSHGALRPHNIVVLSDAVEITGLPHHRGLDRKRFVAAIVAQERTAYLAPEALDSEGKVDGRADVYSLATLVVEMITSQRFTGSLQVLEELSPALAGALERALTERVQARAAGPEEILQALEESASAGTRAQYPAGLDVRAAVFPAKLLETPKPRSRAFPKVVGAVAAAAVLAGGVVVWRGLGVDEFLENDGHALTVPAVTTEQSSGSEEVGWEVLEESSDSEHQVAEEAPQVAAVKTSKPEVKNKRWLTWRGGRKTKPRTDGSSADEAAPIPAAAPTPVPPALSQAVAPAAGASLAMEQGKPIDPAVAPPPPPPPPPTAVPSTEPEFISGPPIAYTRQAALRRIEGDLSIRCTITEAGTVRDCKALKSLPFLDESVIEALGARKYKPATRGGRPVAVDFTFNIRMVLK